MTRAPHRGPAGSARAAAAALALALLAPAALAGCGVGEGERDSGSATLTVTRDYGAEPLLEARVENPSASETVLRALDREAEVETRYGGGFVHSIDGLAGGFDDGRRLDWFFYVNGLESPVGAADVEVAAGDRIWWDHHDWTDLMRVPAVVGSYPEPFLEGAAGRPVGVACLSSAEPSPCERVTDALAREGVETEASVAGDPTDTGERRPGPAVVVGPWRSVRSSGDARLLEADPARSHVFARFERRGDGWRLALMDQGTTERRSLGAGAGLVAATAPADGGPPTWLVTGTDAEGAAAAAAALSPVALRDRFAIAAPASREPIPLPVAEPG